MTHRRFHLHRVADATGISGTGIVGEGVEFTDGTTVMRWRELPEDDPNYIRGVRATTVVYPSVDAVLALHGHNGWSRIDWID